MQCPKDKSVELFDGHLPTGPQAKCCPDCGGAWISSAQYLAWQQAKGVNPEAEPQVTVLPSTFSGGTAPALDNRAALCPECQHYLARGRVSLQDIEFFVEYCPNCQGYWCDGGEWAMLQAVDLDLNLQYIFDETWQAQVKALDASQRERKATVEKLGPELAARVFDLADQLQNHPNGDFGVAYMMRRFDT
ncbi:MAG: hypothetical protein ACFB0C_03215 [Leptolyngbyaceae cyanobacterium]